MDATVRSAVIRFAQAWGLPHPDVNDVTPIAAVEHDRTNRVDPDVFEVYAAAQVLIGRHRLAVDPQDILSLVTGGYNDSKIDALAIVLNGRLILSHGDLEDFAAENGEDPVAAQLIFIQATMREGLSEAKVGGFCAGVTSFLYDTPLFQENERIAYWRGLKHAVLQYLRTLPEVPLLKCALYVVWPGQAAAIVGDRGGMIEVRRRDLVNTGLFTDVTYEVLDCEALLMLQAKAEQSNSALLNTTVIVQTSGEVGPRDIGDPVLTGPAMTPQIPSHAAPTPGDPLFPATNAAPNAIDYARVRAWSAQVHAQELVRLVSDADGQFNSRVFTDNVRGFLGYERRLNVNSDIAATLQGAERGAFGFMNNGVTIVAERAEMEGAFGLRLEDFQIVNGCQTTSVLWENRESLTPDVTVPVRIIETGDARLIDRIVRATNAQTPIDPLEMLSREPLVRRIQWFYEMMAQREDQPGLLFERRLGEFGINARSMDARVIALADVVRGYAAMFLEVPHDVHGGHWRAMATERNRRVLAPHHEPELYYLVGLLTWAVRRHIASEGTRQGFIPQFQVCLALRHLIEPDPGWSAVRGLADRAAGRMGYIATCVDRFTHSARIDDLVGEAVMLVRTALEELDLRPTGANARKAAVTETVIAAATARRHRA